MPTCAQNPKSESLTFPSAANRMESDFMSRWITPYTVNIYEKTEKNISIGFLS